MKKRIVISYALLILLFTAMTARVSSLAFGTEYTEAAARQSSDSLQVGEVRGNIYDRNLKPLVNRTTQTLLTVAPTPEAVAALRAALSDTAFGEAAAALESGRPALLRCGADVRAVGIRSFTLPVRAGSDALAVHVVGYTGSSGGVTGIEAAYDELLSGRWGGSVSVRYTVNARGEAVGDASGEVADTREYPAGGVVLTLDRAIQAVVEEKCAVIPKGAAVMMKVDTGEIVAMASMPDFDVTDVAASLDSEDSPLYNRALAAYNVGSAFKICVAAAALEAGIPAEETYDCQGYYQLGDRRYYCHNRAGHGELTLWGGIEQSCNPYFIALGQKLGARAILEMAQALGFGRETVLADGIVAASGTLPEETMTAGELANLSFGQGKLTATPVQLCAMAATVANGGVACTPSLVLGVTDDGASIQRQKTAGPVRAMSASTAELLRSMLVDVVENGTGKKAASSYFGCGGKTSSAQTGVYVEGEEVVHGWFVGFFPSEDPEYALAVLSEGGEAGGQVPATVFREICDAVYLFEHLGVRRDTQ